MKKNMKLLVALIVTLFTLPIFGSAVLAETGASFEDGEHNLNYLILKGDANDESSAARSFVKPAKLTVENGTNTVQLNFTGRKMIDELKIQDLDSEIIPNGDNAGILKFNVDNLSETLYMDMVINLGPKGTMEHTVRLFLNVEAISDIPEEQLESSIIKDEQKEVADGSNENITFENNYSTIKFNALHAEKNEASAMARFMADTAFVSNQDGKVFVTLAFADENVTQLLLNDQDAIAERVEGITRYETFEFDSLPAHVEAYVEYKTVGHTGKADFRVVFDEATVAAATEGDMYKAEYVPAPRPNQSNQKEEAVTKETDNNKEEQTKEPVKGQTTPDKAYEVNFVVKHAIEDKESAANRFFVKPAVLLTKNGVNYLQLTVTNSDMIDSLRTANGDVVVVQENADGSMVVQFKVNGNLGDPIELDMHITVPGMYSQEHSARLILDVDSMTEIAVDNYEIAESANNNGVVKNPATGDSSNLLLYVLLLIGSSIPLAIMLKRRFA